MPLAYSYQTAVAGAASYGKPQHAQRAAGSQEGRARGCAAQISLLGDNPRITLPSGENYDYSYVLS